VIEAIEIIGGVVAFSACGLGAFSVKIVREYQRVVLFRLGRSMGIKGPGLVFINPVTDRTSLVDLRERFLEIPHQTAITQDNASISIDFIIFYKVVDPAMSVLEVQNFAAAAQNVAATTLRSVVGDMLLDDVLSKREEMNASLRMRLDDVTERWGVRVTTVEVREVNPPTGVLQAMTRQMSAERTRRAVNRQAAILGAEGERQAAILRAEGLAAGLEAISTVGQHLDGQTMHLQYLQILKDVGTAPSTKIVIPMELGGLVGGLQALLPNGSAPSPADRIGETDAGASKA
jgi:regulator of protease activity HflC (stomatin/prohibitin superfamily)